MKTSYCYVTWLQMVENMNFFLHVNPNDSRYNMYKNMLQSMVRQWVAFYDTKKTEDQIWWELEETATNGAAIKALQYIH